MTSKKPTATPIFGVVSIDGKRCSSEGCGGEPVSVMPVRTPEDGTSVVWACEEHTQALTEAGISTSEITRTCGMGDDTPCGAFATNMAIIGDPETKQLGIVSVCKHHAAQCGSERTERDALEREIDRVKTEMLRIDEDGEFVHTVEEKWEFARELSKLEARVEEWR